MNLKSRKLRLVVSDDHTMFREGLVSLLNRESDFEVVGAASDGCQALAMCQSEMPDVLLVDLTMPGLDGLEVISKVLAVGCCSKAVLLSMHRHPSIAVDAQKAGASGYVLKEEAFEELVHVIRAVMDDDVFIEPIGCSDGANMLPGLSPREKSVLQLLVLGRTNKEIATDLSLSVKTIETFRARIMKKTGSRNTADMVRYAHQAGLS